MKEKEGAVEFQEGKSIDINETNDVDCPLVDTKEQTRLNVRDTVDLEESIFFDFLSLKLNEWDAGLYHDPRDFFEVLFDELINDVETFNFKQLLSLRDLRAYYNSSDYDAYVLETIIDRLAIIGLKNINASNFVDVVRDELKENIEHADLQNGYLNKVENEKVVKTASVDNENVSENIPLGVRLNSMFGKYIPWTVFLVLIIGISDKIGLMDSNTGESDVVKFDAFEKGKMAAGKTLESSERNIDLLAKTEIGSLNREIVDLWGSYKKGEVTFKYFDRTNNFNYVGESTYKGARDMVKINKLHKDFREGKSDRLMRVSGQHSIFPMNSMFKYDIRDNKYTNIMTPADVHGVYLKHYNKDMRDGYEDFVENLHNVSSIAKVLKNSGDNEIYDFLVAQIAQESSFNSGAKSDEGAYGIAQITEPAATDIHDMIMINQSRKVNFARYRSKEGGKEIIRMLTFYDLLIKRVGKNNQKEFNVMLEDKRLFKHVLFPILLTGYNQGHLNARSIFDFLINSHNAGDIDKKYYLNDKKTLNNLNDDVILYLLTKSYDLARSKEKDLGKLDDKSKTHQAVLKKNNFGEDGVSYFIRISAIKAYFGKFKDKKPAKVIVKKAEGSNSVPSNDYKKALILDVKNVKPLSYYKGRSLEGYLKGTGLYKGQKLYSKRNFKKVFDPISWHFYEDLDEIKTTFGDDYKYIRLAKDKWGSVGLDQKLYGPDKKVIGVYEIDEYERMLILKRNLNVYIQIAKEVHQKTGKYLEINSTFRDRAAQKKHGKVEKSFHETGKAIDLREATFNVSERKEVEKIFAKYAAAGYLTFRTHGGHYHLVFHGERYREAIKKYFAESDLTKAKRELMAEVARIDKTSKKK